MEKLKPCPFCGGEFEAAPSAISVIYDWSHDEESGELLQNQIYVHCDICGARTDIYNTDAEAIGWWNTRSK